MKLQELRKSKGMSQSKLSEISKVKLRTIQQYENGQRNIDGARIEILCKLSEAMDCKIYDIIENEELKRKLKNRT